MAMVQRPGADEWVPDSRSLPRLREAAEACRGCELHRDATQTVFGRGRARSRLVLVGEQPGDQEDRTGKPFVGPAGKLLDEAMEQAGIDRRDAYLTNAVKHFRFVERGKRRLHQKPAVGNVVACHPWLRAEVQAVRPEIIIALGATAARALLGHPVTVGSVRGEVLDATEETGTPVLVTTHPSALLRVPEPADREAAFRALVDDLRTAANWTPEGRSRQRAR